MIEMVQLMEMNVISGGQLVVYLVINVDFVIF